LDRLHRFLKGKVFMPSCLSVRRVLAIIVLFSCSISAQAQLFRAYLSIAGADTNPCTVQLPCRLLPAALAAVADGGEVWMVDSANFNTSQVNVSKSVTILAVPGTVGSLVATGGAHGLLVNAPGAKVTLRNLVLVKLGASGDGISYAQGASLIVEDCTVSNMDARGIAAYGGATFITVRNTALRANNIGFYAAGTARATLDHVHSENNLNAGVQSENGAQVTVSNSVLSNNGADALLSRSTVTGVSTRAMVDRTLMTGSIACIRTSSIAGADANATATDSVLEACSNGFMWAHSGGGENIRTFENNKVGFEVFNVTNGGTLVPMTGASGFLR
jgi:hypothetical protein